MIQLICLTLSKPSPMTPMLQKLPVSVLSIFTFKEVITYALALERGGDEALQQVIAKVEVALFARVSIFSQYNHLVTQLTRARLTTSEHVLVSTSPSC